ncbi:MAG: SDR family oxidoreductase [Oligoflexia bacterium]|nr:SDR family oxidoreductase [Oligoflexia bacterium]
MKIAIIGANGKAGQEIYKEAIKRGHDTTALVRDGGKAKGILGANTKIIEKDAFDLTQKDLAALDVIVDCFATPPPQAYRHIDLTAKLVSLFRETESPRLIFILGAGSLRTGADKHLLVEDIKHMAGSEAWINIPIQQLKQLKFLQEVDNVNWTGISPSALFEPGPANGVLLGKDDLLYSGDGKSHTTTGTMAVAVLDEIERPAHVKQRFTVADS